MSYTTTIAVYPGEKTEPIEEYRNSHGSAPIVWERMAQQYLGVGKSYDHPGLGWMQLAAKSPSPLWELWKDPRVKTEHKLVHMLTFDRAYVAKENYKRMAEAIRVFLRDMPVPDSYANHWPAFAAFFESDPDYPGVGLYCTSVSENPFDGPWNEEKEAYDSPNWDDVYEVCAAIDSLVTVP